MIDLLEHYIHDSLPQWGDFSTNPNLTKKVDANGNLLPFLGNTVVFLLDEKTKDALAKLQDQLYYWGGELLAQPPHDPPRPGQRNPGPGGAGGMDGPDPGRGPGAA